MTDERVRNLFCKNVIGKEMINSGLFTDEELLFFIPNSKRHMLGYPTKRYVGKKNKHKEFCKRLQQITYPRIFDLVQKFFDKYLEEEFKKTISNMVDIKDVDIGVKV